MKEWNKIEGFFSNSIYFFAFFFSVWCVYEYSCVSLVFFVVVVVVFLG